MTPSVMPHGASKFTDNDVNFAKYFKAITACGKKVFMNVFLLIYKDLQTDGGKTPISDYCKLSGWSNAKLRKVFTNSERRILDGSPLDPDFEADITLYYKLLLQFSPDISHILKNDLKTFKNLRNSVCHEEFQLDSNSFEKKMEELVQLCRKILSASCSFFQVDQTVLMSEIEDEIRDIASLDFDLLDLKRYLQLVDAFRGEKQSQMIYEGRRELKKIYSKLDTLVPCMWMQGTEKFSRFTVDSTFTQLQLSFSSHVIPVSELLEVVLLKERFDPRVLIVSGVMGAGKSSLCRYLLHEWTKFSTEVRKLAEFDLLLFVELGSINCSSLLQFLREQLLKNTCQMFADSDIIPILQDVNVLFVVDGVDEASLQGKYIINEILEKFTESRIIFTTRPDHVLDLKYAAEDHVILDLLGFDEQSSHEFVSRVLKTIKGDPSMAHQEEEAFIKYLSKTTQNTNEYLRLPLSVILLLILWCEDHDGMTSATTMTQLYCKINSLLQQKLAWKLSQKSEGHHIQVHSNIKRWFHHLCEVAHKTMSSDDVTIGSVHVTSLMEAAELMKLPPVQTMSTFLRCHAVESATGPKYTYDYMHVSQAEFLAAMHIADTVRAGGCLSRLFEQQKLHAYEILTHVTGLLEGMDILDISLAETIVNVVFKKIGEETNNAGLWWRLLTESLYNPAICHVIGATLAKAASWKISSNDSKETRKAQLALLRISIFVLKEVEIRLLYNEDFEELEHLKEILCLLAANKITKVSLILEKEFYTAGDLKCLDEYVVPIMKQNNLTEFVGHAGMNFCFSLGNALGTKTVFARITSIESLISLARSARKHKTRVPYLRKSALKYIELFIDFELDEHVSRVSRMKWNRSLVARLNFLNDETALFAGLLLNRLNHKYCDVILQKCDVSPAGFKRFLKEAGDVKIKSVYVMSSVPISQEDMESVKAVSCRAEIRWGRNS